MRKLSFDVTCILQKMVMGSRSVMGLETKEAGGYFASRKKQGEKTEFMERGR